MAPADTLTERLEQVLCRLRNANLKIDTKTIA